MIALRSSIVSPLFVPVLFWPVCEVSASPLKIKVKKAHFYPLT